MFANALVYKLHTTDIFHIFIHTGVNWMNMLSSGSLTINAQGAVALASNSRADAPGCERATFEVVADTFQRVVTATVVTLEPRTISVSAPLPVG